MWMGKDPRIPLPMILGHEGIGRVVDCKGPRRDVYGEPIAIGELVLWERGTVCGECYYCAVLQEPLLCPSRWVYGIHRSHAVKPHLNGCYATHLILDRRTQLIPLGGVKDPLPFVAASCSGATAAHVFSLSPARIGDTVVILGPGPLGAFCAAIAESQGAEHVIVVGGTAERLEICRRMGATATLNRHASTPEETLSFVLDVTHGRGADLVVEASGSVDAAREGLDLARPGGTISFVGFGAPVGEMTMPPFETLVRKNVRLQGVWVSDVRHTLQALSLIRKHPGGFSSLVTHRFDLSDTTKALEAVARRQAMKAVLLPNGTASA